MTDKEIQRLADKYLQGIATEEEEDCLHRWYESKGYDLEELIILSEGEDIEAVKSRLFGQVQAKIDARHTITESDSLVNKVGVRRWMYYAAALLIVSLIGIYYFTSTTSEPKTFYTETLQNDIGPGGNNAILELENGSLIDLDQINIGELIDLDGVTVSKVADGVLSINTSDFSDAEFNRMNTIKTPPGGQYNLILPDGTKVWLNASSILKFPNVFDQKARQVDLTGEAYFEVAQKKTQSNLLVPFYVDSKSQRIEVLGTQFNINSYPNENIVKTTLLEGSVRVSALSTKAISHVLLPGQQSQLQGNQLDVKEVDIESEISWKNGDFIFNNEALKSIMRKIERWYDVEVHYQSSNNELKFSGAVSRTKNLSEVLSIMELTGKVKFKIEGRRVVVM